MPVPFVSLRPDWVGRRVFLIGGGPSLRGFDFSRLHGGLVVAINDAAKAVPDADCILSSDVVWIWQRRDLLAKRRCERIAVVPDDFRRDPIPGVRYIRRVPAPGLSDRMDEVRTGFNSGFAALGVALMRGASEIYLLGYDMSGPGHFHRGYEWPCQFGAKEYPSWAALFETLVPAARGSRVVNCNPNSGVRCFPFADIDEVLA